MENQTIKHREWVKTAAIIFLSVLLVLTFFSNTIMNRSLPEVAAQYVQSGTINAKIRGSGTISANETYDVTLSQTRKIRSVLVKVGQEVSTGDTLFTLEAADSDELKQAQDTLSQMEADYQKSLITVSNDSSTENRDIQKLRDAYNEALATYRLYSNADPSQITVALEQKKIELTNAQRDSADLEENLASLNNEYTKAQQDVTTYTADVTSLQGTIDGYEKELDTLQTSLVDQDRALANAKAAVDQAQKTKDRDWVNYAGTYNKLKEYATDSNGNVDYTLMAAYAEYPNLLIEDKKVDPDISKGELGLFSTAYNTIEADNKALQEAQTTYNNLKEDYASVGGVSNKIAETKRSLSTAQQDLRNAQRYLSEAETQSNNLASHVDSMNGRVKAAKRNVEDIQALITQYEQASTAATTLKSAQEALEDKVFTANLGDTNAVDLQRSKEALEGQRKTVEKLSADSDGGEVKAKVSGVISAINVTAGNNAGADTAIATITVADRGYTVQISVTNDQARQVKIGDTAEITNFWKGNLTATLENITNDPKNMGNGKLLVFRLTGDGAEAGTNLTLSIGQKSANYDTLIPNSAVRSDANGSFVLVVVAKSSPLGNRYVATRADIQVLASDDTTSAVSGLANGDFVITTSTEPIEAGKQVRLVDNG